MSIIDKSLHFGLQNYFCCAQDETDVTYNYYGYINRKGALLFMRTNKTATEIRFYSTNGDFTAKWALKATYTYLLPYELGDPIV